MNPGWRNNYLRYKSYFLNVVGNYRERADIRAYLEILMSLLTISIFSIFALKPTLLTIAELIKDIEAKRQTLSVMEEKIQNLSKAQSLYDRERSNITLLKNAVPDKAEPLVFARQIEGLSEKHSSQVLGMNTKEALLKGGKQVVLESKSGNDKNILPFPEGAGSLSITITTSSLPEEYKKIPTFLSDIEKLRQLLFIDSLNINLSEEKVEEQEQKTIVTTVNGRLPVFLEKEQ